MNKMRKIRVRFIEMRVAWLNLRMNSIARRMTRRIDRIECRMNRRITRLERRAHRLLVRAERINKKIK